MNDFDKGVQYAFEYIEKHMIGMVGNYGLESVVTKKMLKELKKKVPKKCDSCPIPCGQSWCSTVKEE